MIVTGALKPATQAEMRAAALNAALMTEGEAQWYWLLCWVFRGGRP